MARILDPYHRRLDRRVALEVGTDQLPVPGPAVLGIAGGVNAGKTAPGLDVAFERDLLAAIEDVTRCQEEHHRPVTRQIGICEGAGIFGGVYQITMLGSELHDGSHRGRDRRMSVGRGSGED